MCSYCQRLKGGQIVRFLLILYMYKALLTLQRWLIWGDYLKCLYNNLRTYVVEAIRTGCTYYFQFLWFFKQTIIYPARLQMLISSIWILQLALSSFLYFRVRFSGLSCIFPAPFKITRDRPQANRVLYGVIHYMLSQLANWYVAVSLFCTMKRKISREVIS